jgi:hypothetical protein
LRQLEASSRVMHHRHRKRLPRPTKTPIPEPVRQTAAADLVPPILQGPAGSATACTSAGDITSRPRPGMLLPPAACCSSAECPPVTLPATWAFRSNGRGWHAERGGPGRRAGATDRHAWANLPEWPCRRTEQPLEHRTVWGLGRKVTPLRGVPPQCDYSRTRRTVGSRISVRPDVQQAMDLAC